MSLALLAACLVATCLAGALLARIDAALGEASALLDDPRDPDLRALRDAVSARIRRGLPPRADGRGLRSVALRAAEAHDRERDLAAVLARLGSESPPEEPREHEARVKALLQVSDALDLDEPATDALLAPALARLRGAPWLDRRVGAVERVRAGATIDRETMWPLNNGTRVARALGVVIRDDAGKVLSRAKVLCG